MKLYELLYDSNVVSGLQLTKQGKRNLVWFLRWLEKYVPYANEEYTSLFLTKNQLVQYRGSCCVTKSYQRLSGSILEFLGAIIDFQHAPQILEILLNTYTIDHQYDIVRLQLCKQYQFYELLLNHNQNAEVHSCVKNLTYVRLTKTVQRTLEMSIYSNSAKTPSHRGVYAFPFPFVELYLCSGNTHEHIFEYKGPVWCHFYPTDSSKILKEYEFNWDDDGAVDLTPSIWYKVSMTTLIECLREEVEARSQYRVKTERYANIEEARRWWYVNAEFDEFEIFIDEADYYTYTRQWR